MALANPPDPQQPVVRPSDGRVDEDWYRWFLAFVLFCQQLFASLGDLEDDVGGLSITIADCWQHTIIKAADGTYVMVQKAPFAGTITSTVSDCDSGTCTIRATIDGVNVGSTANSVSTTEAEQTHSTANTFAAGATIAYVISSNSSAEGVRFQINYSREVSPA